MGAAMGAFTAQKNGSVLERIGICYGGREPAGCTPDCAQTSRALELSPSFLT